MSYSEEFKRGQPVWDETRKQPNGYIFDVQWRDREVVVKFYDGSFETYEFDEIGCSWTDKFYGGWWITQ